MTIKINLDTGGGPVGPVGPQGLPGTPGAPGSAVSADDKIARLSRMLRSLAESILETGIDLPGELVNEISELGEAT